MAGAGLVFIRQWSLQTRVRGQSRFKLRYSLPWLQIKASRKQGFSSHTLMASLTRVIPNNQSWQRIYTKTGKCLPRLSYKSSPESASQVSTISTILQSLPVSPLTTSSISYSLFQLYIHRDLGEHRGPGGGICMKPPSTTARYASTLNGVTGTARNSCS